MAREKKEERKVYKYLIKAEYRTGDSFKSYDTSEIMEGWDNLDIAKENLERIKIHYKYYEYKTSNHRLLYSSKSEKKKWEEFEANLPSFIIISKDYLGYPLLKLLTDDRSEYQLFPPWCGYFETLYGAEIILNNKREDDTGMSFKLRDY
jgi:hypothetical protein